MKRKILIVDDDAACEGSGESATGMLGGDWDLVLADIGMPGGMDGLIVRWSGGAVTVESSPASRGRRTSRGRR